MEEPKGYLLIRILIIKVLEPNTFLCWANITKEMMKNECECATGTGG